MEKITKEKIAAAWSSKRPYLQRIRWWQSPRIIRHVNKIICGKEIEGWNSGPLVLLNEKFNNVFHNAISIGSGNCSKEITLVAKNIVEHFDIFELSPDKINEAKNKIKEKNMQNNFTFYCEDYFSIDSHKKYDLFFWDNSLHHMFDTAHAVQKSYAALNTGGCFFCNDFVGQSRFQWTELELLIVNRIRSMLDESLFFIGNKRITRYCTRPSLECMIEIDPSEAADSERIIPSVKETFNDPLIIHTGGLIYHLCLSDILQNINENSKLLDQLLDLDIETIKHNFYHYAFILCKK